MFRQTLVLLTALLLLSNNSFAQSPFSEPERIFKPDVIQPKEIRNSDIDNDGDVDLATFSTKEQNISLFINDEIYNTWEHVVLKENIVINQLWFKDFNDDTFEDIFVSTSDEIIRYENDGNGNFGNEIIVADSFDYSISDFELVDLDNDSDLDILVVLNNVELYLLKNNSGIFSDPIQIDLNTSLAGSSSKMQLCIVDLDNDEKLDIVYFNGTTSFSEFRYLKNLGNGIFDESTDISGSNYGPITDIAAWDFNNNGYKDLVISAKGNTGFTVAIIFNNGNGSFQYRVPVDETSHRNSITICDIDNDNKPDIVATSITATQIVWFKNLGNGEFGSAYNNARILNNYMGDGLNTIAIDLDSDNDLDLVSTALYRNKINWFENIDDGQNWSSHYISNTTGSYNPITFMDNADIDGNGYDDILFASSSEERIAVMNNDGETFSNPRTLTKLNSINSITIGNLNEDNSEDLITYSYNQRLPSQSISYPSGVQYLKNNSDNTASVIQELEFLVNPGTYSFQIGDLNGDNKNDVLATRYPYSWTGENNSIRLFQANEADSFDVADIIYQDSIVTRNTILEDIDNDNDLDILYYVANSIYVLKNDGLGNFSASEIFLNTDFEQIKSFFFFDYNKDDVQDLICYGLFDDEYILRKYVKDNLNNTYETSDLINYGTQSVTSIKIEDINKDGYFDFYNIFYEVSTYTQKLTIHLNDGLDNFTNTFEIGEEGNRGLSTLLFDYDNDNDLDLITTSGISDGQVYLHKNESVDIIAPTAICFDSINLYLDETGTGQVTLEQIDNGSFDNYTIDSYNLDVTEFSCNQLGFKEINLTVTDGEGYSNACRTIVNILDTISPVAGCADTLIMLTDENEEITLNADDFLALSYDNCGIETIALSQNQFNADNVGSNTVTLIVEDAYENVDSCNINVEIEITTSVFNSKNYPKITLSPNPLRTETILKWEVPFNFNVKIYNVLGNEVRSYSNQSNSSLIVEKGDFAIGMYIINFYKSGNNSVLGSYKLMVE